MSWPQIVDFDCESVLLAWQPQADALAYELQMTVEEGEDPTWISLSATLTATSVRKKNMKHDLPYRFRVNCKYSFGWDTFSQPTPVFVLPPMGTKFLPPPALKSRDATSVTLEWQEVENSSGYQIRYRPENQLTWEYVESTITSTVVRKKGLVPCTKYCFSVRPLHEDVSWGYSASSQPYAIAEVSKARIHKTSCGYTTMNGRMEFLAASGITDKAQQKLISESLTADTQLDAPLYHWQLFSVMGIEHIHALVTSFYDRVYDDTQEQWFRDAFARISDKEHHINTQTAYWVDAMGGGKYYHGGDYRLNFHHTHNAQSVMTAAGAARWMYHMRGALRHHKETFNQIDRRIVPCIVNFLRVKMYKYAREHNWTFDVTDFDEAGK